MTFPRVKPSPGFVINEKMTSAQANQLDIDHSNAIDKTGDNAGNGGGISGQVDVLSGGKLHANNGSNVEIASGGILTVDSGGYLQANAGSQVRMTVSSGAFITVGAGGVIATSSTGIIQGAGKQIQISDGNDITFQTPRSISVFQPLLPAQGTIGIPSVYTTPQFKYYGADNAYAGYNNVTGSTLFRIDKLIPGATLSTVEMFCVITGVGRIAALPNMPWFYVSRSQALVDGTTYGLGAGTVTLGSTAYFPTPATVSAYSASGVYQSWVFTCTTNNVIDTSKYLYAIQLSDESGSAYAAGNVYFGAKLTYTNVTNYSVQL